MSMKRTERQLARLDVEALDDDDLDYWLGEAKRVRKSLKNSTAIQTLRDLRKKRREAVDAKLEELTTEAEERGIRVRRKKKKKTSKKKVGG